MKMANGRLLFQALHMYSQALVLLSQDCICDPVILHVFNLATLCYPLIHLLSV